MSTNKNKKQLIDKKVRGNSKPLKEVKRDDHTNKSENISDRKF